MYFIVIFTYVYQLINSRSDFGSTGEFWAIPAHVIPENDSDIKTLISELDLEIPSPEGKSSGA